MNIYKNPVYALIFLTIFISLYSTSCKSYIYIQQTHPPEHYISGAGAVDFQCNASGNESITSLSLDIYSYNTTIYRENYYNQLQINNNTLLLCHFNRNYTCNDENATHTGTSFGPSVIGQGVHINDSDNLTLPSSGNIDLNEGTLELWLKTPPDTQSQSWIFIAGDDPSFNKNEIRLWIENGNLYFRIYNDFEEASTVVRNISSWQQGTWHYITAVWDTSTGGSNDWDWMDVSVDASNQSNTYTVGDYIMYKGTITGNIHIGSYKDGTMQINSTIDELRISNKKMSFTEINDTYSSFFSLHNTSSLWHIQNLNDGEYLWKCISSTINTNTTSSPNRTFYVDNSTPPSVSNITLSPNSSDDIDPGISITITANITDPSNVSTSILYYKRSTISTWSSKIMNHTTGDIWTASFLLSSPPGTWDYKIWCNDTRGNSAYTQQHNLTAEYDYSWSASPQILGEAYIFFNTEGSIGTISISNTGDYPLNFKISSDFPSTHFNISNPESFDIDANTTLYINITAVAPSEPGEYPVHITINETSGTSSQPIITINSTLISYWGGPYLVSRIERYENIVYQSTNTTYAFKTRNIGNETAENVWINWTLPYGWSVVSGNLTLFAGNITNGSVVWNNITVYVSSSAHSGVFPLYANATSSGNITSSSTITVSVICNSSDNICGSGCSYINDADCAEPKNTPASGGPTIVPGSSVTVVMYEMFLNAPKRIDAVQNTTQTFRAIVTNPMENTILRKTSISVSGYIGHLVRVVPSNANIYANNSAVFFITLRIPSYLECGRHALMLEAESNATSTISHNFITLKNTTTVYLYVHRLPVNSSQNIISEALSAIAKIKKTGTTPSRAESLLNTMMKYINESRNDEAVGLLRQIFDEAERATRTKLLIKNVSKSIAKAEKYGISTPKTKLFYSLAVSAFARGDFIRSENRAKSALITYKTETSGVLAIMEFVHGYWWLLFSLFFIAVVFLAFMRKLIKLRLAKRRLKALSKEEKSIKTALKNLQNDYFNDFSISREDYTTMLSHYTERLARIKSDKTKQKMLIDSIMGKGRNKTLKERKQRLESLIRSIQMQYFSESAISKTAYEKTLSLLISEIADIERRLQKDTRRTRFLIFAFALIFLILTLSLSFAASQKPQCIADAENTTSQMKQSGFGTQRAEDLLKEANRLAGEGHMLAACAVAEKINEIQGTALKTSRMIDDVEAEIYQTKASGHDTTKAEEVFYQALDAFRREDYNEAQTLLSRTSDIIDNINSRALYAGASANPIAQMIYAHSTFLIVLLFIAVFFAYSLSRINAIRTGRKTIAMLRKEEDSIKSAIKTIQIQYFHTREKSKKEYDEAMNTYRKRIAEIRKQIILLTNDKQNKIRKVV